MAIANPTAIVDARRFTKIGHATVLPAGRLRFASDAAEMMCLNEATGIVLFDVTAQGPRVVFGAVACRDNDPRAFPIKTSGPYRYISVRDFLVEKGIDFRNFSVSYEVTAVDEEFNGHPVFALTQFQVPRTSKSMIERAESRGRLEQLENPMMRTRSVEEIIAEKDAIVRKEIELVKYSEATHEH